MPIYGYRCDDCGRMFETLVRGSETATCPSCDSQRLTQQLSVIAPPAKGGSDAPMCESGGNCCGTCPMAEAS